MTFLEDLRINWIAFVDKGASIDSTSGEGAHILLFKINDINTAVAFALFAATNNRGCDELYHELIYIPSI